MTSSRRSGDPDPYPSYAFLREHAPVSVVAGDVGTGRTWLVTSYDLCRACLGDPRLSSDSRKIAAAVPASRERTGGIERNLLGLDPPDHTRLRRVLSAAFSASSVARLKPRIEQICMTAISGFRSRGMADLGPGYALAVPVAVIHDVLGIPQEQRKEPGDCFDLFCRMSFADNDSAASVAVAGYLDNLIGYKREYPGDDVTTALLRELDAGRLRSEGELRATMFVIIGAGHTTTYPFLGAAILRSLQMDSFSAEILAEPNACSRWLNEILRHDSPVQASQRRYALTDLSIGGVRITAGDTVIVSFAAANRDASQFNYPDQVRYDRGSYAHLAFGYGSHFCLGANLARAEGEIALRLLFGELPDIRLIAPPETIPWAFGPMLRGPRELLAEFSPS